MARMDGGPVIIKPLAELAEPDEASLAIRPLDIDPERVAEGVAEYRQSLVASFELVDDVPESTRSSYERVRNIYTYGVLSYDLYTVAGNQARLVIEQAGSASCRSTEAPSRSSTVGAASMRSPRGVSVSSTTALTPSSKTTGS
jgi:hypothetical protein